MIRAAFLMIGTFTLLWVLAPVESFAFATAGLSTGKVQASISRDTNPGIVERVASSTKKKRKKCPQGQLPDGSGGCFSCSHNDHFENGVCVPCKPGFHEETQADDNGDQQQVCAPDGKKKSKVKSCGAGQEFKNGKCRKTEFPPIEECADGQRLDPASGTCFSCSHNDHFDANGVCVPCAEGFHVDGDSCVAD